MSIRSETTPRANFLFPKVHARAKYFWILKNPYQLNLNPNLIKSSVHWLNTHYCFDSQGGRRPKVAYCSPNLHTLFKIKPLYFWFKITYLFLNITNLKKSQNFFDLKSFVLMVGLNAYKWELLWLIINQLLKNYKNSIQTNYIFYYYK